MSKIIKWEKYYPNIEDESDDFIESEDEFDEGRKPKTLVQTPFGIFQLNNSLNPFNRFNFWIANTNFNISKKVRNQLNLYEGIEAVIVLSRYQFIIGIGKLFNEKTIKNGIEDMLCGSSKCSSFKTLLDSTYKYWTAYIFPNMNVDCFGSNDLKEVKDKIEFYIEAKKLSQGKIFVSKTIKELKV